MRLTPRQPQVLEVLRQHVATGLVEPLDRQPRGIRLVPETHPAVPALLLRRAGDRLAFWHRDNALVEAMDEVYRVVEGKNRDRL